MKHQSLRRTREQLRQIAKTKHINEILHITFKKKKRFDTVDQYFVPFELVKTIDLKNMLHRLTITSNFVDGLAMPKASTIDRVLYLKQLQEFSGIDLITLIDDSLSMYQNKMFVDNYGAIVKKLRTELSKREHIPNKKQNKIVRQLKAQGKYIID